MKKAPNWIIVLIVIVLLVLSKFLFFPTNETKSASASKSIINAPIAVNYFVARQGSFLNNVFTTGKIGAINEVNILPEVSGKVTAIYFNEGEMVNKGSMLVKLNDADLQAQLLKVQNQLKLGIQKMERLGKLLEIKGVSREEYDMQENEVTSLKADEAFLNAQIAKTTIAAPFSGVVGLKNISEGAFVNANTPIVSLVQLKPIFVEFSVPEKYGEMMQKGTVINFGTAQVVHTGRFTARVYAIEPRVDEATKTIRVRALYNGEGVFYPGGFVNVYVNLGKNTNAIMIPTQCIIPTLKGQKVFVCRRGLAVEVMVKTGVRTSTTLQVTEGLGIGDTVVATGLLSVKHDSKLTLLKPVN